VSTNSSDAAVSIEMTEHVTRNLRREPRRVLANSGFRSEANHPATEKRKIDAYIALSRGEREPKAAGASRPATHAIARMLATKRGRARYKRRKGIVEPVFGWA
jgi:hypothetical protein